MEPSRQFRPQQQQHRRQQARLACAALLVLCHTTDSASDPWARIQTWCFPTFASLPLTEEQVGHYTRFDMVDLCSPGLHKDSTTGVYATNVTDTSSQMAAEILVRKPSAVISPYIGFELGHAAEPAREAWM